MSNTSRVFYAKGGHKFGLIIEEPVQGEMVMGKVFTEDSISHPIEVPVKNIHEGYIEKILPEKSVETKVEIIRSVNWKSLKKLPSAPQVLALS